MRRIETVAWAQVSAPLSGTIARLARSMIDRGIMTPEQVYEVLRSPSGQPGGSGGTRLAGRERVAR